LISLSSLQKIFWIEPSAPATPVAVIRLKARSVESLIFNLRTALAKLLAMPRILCGGPAVAADVPRREFDQAGDLAFEIRCRGERRRNRARNIMFSSHIPPVIHFFRGHYQTGREVAKNSFR